MRERTMSQTHEHGGEEVGIALGFRIFEAAGLLFMAEAEIAPYEDEPTALGATLLFHPLAELDLTSEMVEEEPPIGALDLGDVLTHDEKAPLEEQFQAILRQLSRMNDDELRRYLDLARQQEEL
jgi:hypothetical protein